MKFINNNKSQSLLLKRRNKNTKQKIFINKTKIEWVQFEVLKVSATLKIKYCLQHKTFIFFVFFVFLRMHKNDFPHEIIA